MTRSRVKRRIDLNAMVEFIREYTNDGQGEGPTYREIGEALGGRSTSAIQYALKRLQRDGRIDWIQGEPRAIRVIDPADDESAG